MQSLARVLSTPVLGGHSLNTPCGRNKTTVPVATHLAISVCIEFDLVNQARTIASLARFMFSTKQPTEPSCQANEFTRPSQLWRPRVRKGYVDLCLNRSWSVIQDKYSLTQKYSLTDVMRYEEYGPAILLP